MNVLLNLFVLHEGIFISFVILWVADRQVVLKQVKKVALWIIRDFWTQFSELTQLAPIAVT